MVSVSNHDVRKTLTDHRMHVEVPQIYQMNCQTNSFQNICDMLNAKIGRLARKINSLQKNTSKSPGFVCTNLGYLTSEVFLDQRMILSVYESSRVMNFHLGHAWRNQMSPLLDSFYTLLWRTRKYHLFLHLLCREFDIRQKRSKCIFMKDPLKKKTTSSLSIEDVHKTKFVEVHKKCIS